METQLSSHFVYQGPVVNVRQDKVQLLDGRVGNRMVIEHPGGVTVMPIMADGKLLFIKQFRYALGKVIIEFPAGKLERGEDPDDAVRRELVEETGFSAKTWTKLNYVYTAPGFCDEKLWFYKAEDLYEDVSLTFDEEEDITLYPLTIEEAWQHIRSGEIADAKTIALLAQL